MANRDVQTWKVRFVGIICECIIILWFVQEMTELDVDVMICM